MSEQQIGAVNPSRGEDQKSFTTLLSHLGTVLDLKAEHPHLEAEDKATVKLERKAIHPIHIEMLPSLLSSTKLLWWKPISSRTVSSRVDDLEYLQTHPLPNSMVVKACQSKSAVRGSPLPASVEGKKLDSLTNKFYATASLSLQAANYSFESGCKPWQYRKLLLRQNQENQT